MKEENKFEHEENLQEEIIQKEIKEKRQRKRKNRKIAGLFAITGITAVVLIVGTYAWFIGTGSIKTSEFEIGVSTEKSLFLSLDGENWSENLTISEAAIMGTLETAAATGEFDTHNAYEGHTNHWVGEDGLVPISTDAAIDSEVSRMMLYGKSSITATKGGFRLISTRIDNYTSDAETSQTVSEKDGYVVFDLFVKNGEGVDYIEEYNIEDDEAIYLTTDSAVTVSNAGTDEEQVEDYGLANSVRVAFMQIGRVATTTEEVGTITSITCNETTTTPEDGGEAVTTTVSNGVTGLCKDVVPTIWEPNDVNHNSNLITYFSRVCKQKSVGEDGTITYDDETACTALEDGTRVPTYVVNQNIVSSDNIDVYDGLNGFTLPTEGSKLTNFNTFTDTMKNLKNENRPYFFKLAANSITKFRVYIYLEGQDVDNYDLISLGKKIKINFGFTKDQFDLANTGTNSEQTEVTEPSA